MGSDAHVYNYTVFGRDVNIASRLEGCAGGDKIIVGEGTYAELLNYDPELASHCIELEPVLVRGIAMPVKIFEVQWQGATSSTAIPFPLYSERPAGEAGLPIQL
jgi:class 3 adenylate cyclase